MQVDQLQSMLEENGEVMVKVEEIDEPLELHLHDTTFDGQTVYVELADGRLQFDAERVAVAWKHHHSIADYGLDD